MTVLVTKTDFQEYVETGANPVFSPRVGHHVWDGSAWVNEGLLHESETRTNLLVDSDLLETQTVTVTAVPHTLHFTGTGSVALSGVYSGSLAGVGSGEQNRQYLTFTPTAGSLVVTVTGSVQQAQLEAGSTPSSYIPTSGTTVPRSPDILEVASANLPYDSTNMSIQMDGRMTYADTDDYEAYYWRWLLDTNRYLQAALDATSTRTGMPRFFQNDTSYTVAQVAGVDAYSPGVNVPYNIASRHGSTFINGAIDGTALTADTTPTALPDLSTTNLYLGYDYMGTIRTFRMWNKDLGDTGIEEAST